MQRLPEGLASVCCRAIPRGEVGQQMVIDAAHSGEARRFGAVDVWRERRGSTNTSGTCGMSSMPSPAITAFAPPRR
jgi:hypothetical protein